MIRQFVTVLSISFLISTSDTPFATAGEADVVKVGVAAEGGGAYRFRVTVRHNDEGWKHYADAWEVIGKDGTIYATRVLAHPHEDEQPFTRNKSGIQIPDGITTVIIRAHDKVHAYGGKTIEVKLPGR